MIVIDTSALIRLAQREPGHERISECIFGNRDRAIAATSLLEFVMVLSRDFADPRAKAENLLREIAPTIVAIDTPHVAAAQQAFFAYGKGRHPARLNFGDCFSYAVAKLANAPLLFVGDDFRQTDVRAAL